MQRMQESIQHTTEDISCAKCSNTEGTFINLECDHMFCMLCASFMYAKSCKALSQEGLIKCIKCESVTQLDQEYITLINETLQNEVLPNIDSVEKPTVPKGAYNPHSVGSRYIQTISRKIKSEQHSFEHHGTPSTAKCFFSKCESPSSRKRNSQPQTISYCSVHNTEPITHLCLSCDARPLCLKCVTTSKRHSEHELKELKKAISILSEQLSINLLEVNDKIQEMELIQRRLDDRTTMIKDRGTKFLTEIREGFVELFQKLEEKEQEVIKNCQDHFASLIENVNEQYHKIGCSIDLLKGFKSKIGAIQRGGGGLELVNKFLSLRNQLGQVSPDQMIFYLERKIEMPSSEITREITETEQKIVNMKVAFKFTNFCRIGASELQNCTSEGKLRKDSQSKRVKTNFGSLNSSRQRRDKKYTKTQEDERRLKTQKTNKCLEKDKKGKMPTYITDFINKKSNKVGSDGSSYGLEMTSPNFESTSKITSKLSKTISPEDIARKKKEHFALLKARIERKTTQPNGKASSKKKKAH